MDLARRIRTVLAAAIAIAAAASAAGPSTALADHPLKPDLVTLGFHSSDLLVQKESKKRILLRLSNEVGNQGQGPFEVEPGGETDTCPGNPNLAPGRYAYQRVFIDTDNGVFDRAVDTDSTLSSAGCMQYHPPHFHWHVLDFAEYSLFDEQTGELAASGGKAGFCLLDSSQPFGALPGMPEDPFYTGGGCSSSPSSPPELEGISVGFADVYHQFTPGQRINVTKLDSGKYCLVSEADPDDLMTETGPANNATDKRIRLNPDELSVKTLPGPCASGA